MGWQLEVGSKRWDGKDERRPIADGWRLMSSYGQRLFLQTDRLTDAMTHRPRALGHPGSGAVVTGAATMGAEGNHPNWCLRRFESCRCRRGSGAVVSDGRDDVALAPRQIVECFVNWLYDESPRWPDEVPRERLPDDSRLGQLAFESWG